LYKLFQEFVTTPPSVSEVVDKKKTGKSRFNLSFSTLALPWFNEIFSLASDFLFRWLEKYSK
jgi:hypothetical protein